ncbi:MAG: OmpW family outer membrane protein [Acidobacteriota bacterium]
MKLCLAVAILILAAVPTFAADRLFDLTGYASYVDPNSSGTFNASNPNQPFDISFNGKLGYGVGANLFLGNHISTEFAASEVKTQSRVRPSGGSGSASGDLKMIPITAVLQWHFAKNAFVDPYIGAGGAYVLFDNLKNAGDVSSLGIREINFKDDVGLVLNAGLGFALGSNFGLLLDGKYVPVKSSATAVYAANGASSTTKVKINPVIFSAGLSFRF